MGKTLIFILLLGVLTIGFKKAITWFADNKNINIVPGTFVEMIAVIVFMFTYGSENTRDIIFMWVSVAVVLAITTYNFIKYGLKDGALASVAELGFSASAAFLLVCIFVARGSQKKRKRA